MTELVALSDELHWPDVAEPYSTALRKAVAYGLTQCEPLGIIATGSILRGEAGPTSDWDLLLIHAEPRRRRLQRRFDGVPTELFINSPASLRSFFAEGHRTLRPSTAHMLTTGFVVLDRDPVVDELMAEAAAWLAKPPEADEHALVYRRYGVVDTLDNARDVRTVDPANARLLLNRAVDDMLTYVFWAQSRRLPRAKAFMATLTAMAPETARLAQRYFASGDLDEALDLAEQLARQTVGETGFFEWSGPWEPFPNHE